MHINFPNYIIPILLFVTVYILFIKLLIYVAKRFATDCFISDFNDVKSKIPPHCKSFRVTVKSFDNPEFKIFLPNAKRLRGFVARLFICEDYIIIKFFDRAMIIENPDDISLSGRFLCYMSASVNEHSTQFVISRKVYLLIEDWKRNKSVN